MIVIPARLASSRLKDKILLPVGGVPLFVATARQVSGVDEVLVAVDEPMVLEIAKSYGLRAVLTSKQHQSGTDRIYEAVSALGLGDDEIIINVQADEPFIEPDNVLKFYQFCRDGGAFMYSCFKLVGLSEAQNPNLVKVVTDDASRALYFSRSIIPYPRAECASFKAHLGIYGYSVASLREFCALSASMLEMTEKLEQLRALQAGKDIKMLEIKSSSIGIDTSEDYERALALV
ncbi:3-deoxy-manno-octulosonate cytidylyltransferase [Campylobacter sp. 19-13652]|uniref:3-deoxy-manno-octulosonate cytidylyltransferase n=1 Tax=Campylobacter sp. 19-13652 TaxID=2840180 RepID=UPI001C75B10E|nr:3-deoxy-manno-octulosonate cytidylyltransferase [Campylobacter sp. 19-13652]BCX79302.1 3-deoxy-manno-octulosonate cytidylyltransferase [Campylobacter sp. 19-13652]